MTTTTLPRLTSLNIELDTTPAAWGELESSHDIADDAPALRARMEEDGYLYLPGFLNREEVIDARRFILENLDEQGALDRNYPVDEAVASPDFYSALRPDLARAGSPLRKVLYGGAMMDFYARFFDEPVRHFDYTWLRMVPPGNGTAPHCDTVYMNRGTTRLFTSWTPLSDISLEMGGLIVLEKSHRHDRLNNSYGLKDVDRFCSNRRDENWTQMGGGGNIRIGGALSTNPFKLRENLGGRWLSSEYQMGDLLVFSIYTVHASLDNQSNRIRLSSDSRYQRASEPADERWIGENPIAHGPEAKRGMIC